MPLTRYSSEAFGVLTICLVALLILLGLVCIAYLFYLRSRVLRQGFVQLSYFSGPWIIRITFILFAIWWGFGEIVRLNFLRRQGRVLNALNLKWQENVCKCYIVSNLGFAEPCLSLTLVFLLRAPLQNMDTEILSRKWNGKTAGYVLLYCLPVFVLQLFLILIGPELHKDRRELPPYFTRTAALVTQNSHGIALCTYPLLNTILLGLFATVLTAYLFWLGRRILKLVINKGLQKRIYTLIFSVSSFLTLFLPYYVVLGSVFACLYTAQLRIVLPWGIFMTWRLGEGLLLMIRMTLFLLSLIRAILKEVLVLALGGIPMPLQSVDQFLFGLLKKMGPRQGHSWN